MNKLIFELIQAQNGNRGLLWTEEDKEEFAALVAAHEREACAQVATKMLRFYTQGVTGVPEAIRARGQA